MLMVLSDYTFLGHLNISSHCEALNLADFSSYGVSGKNLPSSWAGSAAEIIKTLSKH